MKNVTTKENNGAKQDIKHTLKTNLVNRCCLMKHVKDGWDYDHSVWCFLSWRREGVDGRMNGTGVWNGSVRWRKLYKDGCRIWIWDDKVKEDAASDIGIMDVERHRKLKERNFRRRDAFSQPSIRFRAVGSYHCCCWFQQIQDWILVGMFLVQSFGVMVWITGQEVQAEVTFIWSTVGGWIVVMYQFLTSSICIMYTLVFIAFECLSLHSIDFHCIWTVVQFIAWWFRLALLHLRCSGYVRLFWVHWMWSDVTFDDCE